MARQVKRISQLPEAEPLSGDELLEIVQGGDNKRVRVEDLPGGAVQSVQGRTGDVVITADDVGLGSVDNTSDADKPISTAQKEALDEKVDKEAGKGLSTNDFTDPLRDKLVGLEGTHWRGTFVSLAALQAGVTDPEAGDYADVDIVGADVERYIWDATDGIWVMQSGEVAPVTAAQVKQLYESNPDTNAFTDADEAKLDDIQDGATKNATDAQLRDRATHTGVQAIDTVSGLTEALDERVLDTDERLSNARDWAASVVPQAEAEAGESSTPRKWTAQRDRQAVEAWWNQSDGKALLERMVGELGYASFSWDSATSTPAAAYVPQGSTVTSIHRAMKRCVLGRDGVRKFYLDANNSNLTEDGAVFVPTADDFVMVEIPKFYYLTVVVGTVTTWHMSALPLPGYELHPAFMKDGVEVGYRYYGAYEGCVWDASAAGFISGLNLDNASGLLDFGTDYLSSAPGVYPMVGVTRNDSRTLAANIGTGWRQIDFWLVSAVQLLFVIEHQTFNTQAVLGNGNTGGSYLASSSDQNDSPHTIAGASNLLGNGSTDPVTGTSSNNKPGIAYMSYRGIENWYGNAYNWVDGHNINDRQSYVCNDTSAFADDTTVDYEPLGVTMPDTNGYVTLHQPIPVGFLPAAVGGSSSTYWCDNYYQNTGWRVSGFGGIASYGLNAGGFIWLLSNAASLRARAFSPRVAF